MPQLENVELNLIKLPKKEEETKMATPVIPEEEPRPREVPDVADPFPYELPAPVPASPQIVPAQPAPAKV